MRKRIFTACLIILAALLLVLVQGCDLFDNLLGNLFGGVTIEERVTSFLSDLNNDSARDDIYMNLHPDIQNAWKAATVWDATALLYANRPFSFTGMSYEDPATGQITYDISGGAGAETNMQTFDLIMDMKQSGSDWYINGVTIGENAVIQ